MQRRTLPAGIVMGLVLVAGGCGDPDLAARLERLEGRVDALAQQIDGPTAATEADSGVTDDLRSLERRLAQVEQRCAGQEPSANAPGTGAPEVAAARLDERRQRRARLRALTDEYRARLGTIRQNQTDPAARQQATREALEWYRDQRRAVLLGEAPATP